MLIVKFQYVIIKTCMRGMHESYLISSLNFLLLLSDMFYFKYEVKKSVQMNKI